MGTPVVAQGKAFFELFASEYESLLVWRGALLFHDHCQDTLNGVGGLDIKGENLAGEGLHGDLHASTTSRDKIIGVLTECCSRPRCSRLRAASQRSCATSRLEGCVLCNLK
jgi:hypothetical protein